MAGQLYYEDVEVGTDLPKLVKHPTPRQLVMYCGVSEDYYEIHYDKDFARSQGQPDIVVQGELTTAFLIQLVTDWIGEWGDFRKLWATNRKPIFGNEDVVCKGTVARKYIETDEHYVECEIWAENSKGEKCVSARALVVLPVRKSAA